MHSNIIGAAAYRGNTDVLRLIRSQLPHLLTRSSVAFKALERHSTAAGAEQGQLQPELSRYTPLMLAQLNQSKNRELIQLLEELEQAQASEEQVEHRERSVAVEEPPRIENREELKQAPSSVEDL